MKLAIFALLIQLCCGAFLYLQHTSNIYSDNCATALTGQETEDYLTPIVDFMEADGSYTVCSICSSENTITSAYVFETVNTCTEIAADVNSCLTAADGVHTEIFTSFDCDEVDAAACPGHAIVSSSAIAAPIHKCNHYS